MADDKIRAMVVLFPPIKTTLREENEGVRRRWTIRSSLLCLLLINRPA